MATNINTVALTGNLTADPDIRALPSGQSVANLRIAFATGRKNQQTQQWEEKANFIDVTVWGQQAEACGRFLTKGSPVAVMGRLEMDEWEDRNGGGKRSKIEVVAAPGGIQFLHRAPEGGYQQGGQGYPPQQGYGQGYPQQQVQQGYPQAQQQAPPPQGYQAPPPQPGPHQLNQGQGGTDLPPPDTAGLPAQQQGAPPPQSVQPSDDDIPF